MRKIEHADAVQRLSYETLSHETLSHETLGHETLRITQLFKIAMKSNHPGVSRRSDLTLPATLF